MQTWEETQSPSCSTPVAGFREQLYGEPDSAKNSSSDTQVPPFCTVVQVPPFSARFHPVGVGMEGVTRQEGTCVLLLQSSLAKPNTLFSCFPQLKQIRRISRVPSKPVSSKTALDPGPASWDSPSAWGLQLPPAQSFLWSMGWCAPLPFRILGLILPINYTCLMSIIYLVICS